MARTRRSHIVPQFYLKQFSDPSSDRVWVGALKTAHVFSANVSKVAVERDFYASGGAVHEDDLEERLSGIESAAAASWPEALAGTVLSPPVTRFIAWLAARTTWLRRASEVQLHTWLRENLEKLQSTSSSKLGRELPLAFVDVRTGTRKLVPLCKAGAILFNPNFRCVLTQDQFLDMIRIQAHIFASEHLAAMHWIKLTAPDGFSFVTSDRPVAWDLFEAGVSDSPAVLRLPGIRLLVPLSPRVAMMGIRDGSRVFECGISVSTANRQICTTAERYVYGHEPVVRSLMQERSGRLH